MRYGLLYALGVIATSLQVICADSLDSPEISTFEQETTAIALPTTAETSPPVTAAVTAAEISLTLSEPPPLGVTVTEPAQSSETPSSATAEEATASPADLSSTATPISSSGDHAELPSSAEPTSPTAIAADSREATPVSSVTETVATAPPASPPPVIEEIPLVEIPPAPELPSFQEWRDRYVVQLDPAGARRSRKAAQRVRQDAVGAAALGAGGVVYDGDGSDLGSLFVIGDEGSIARAAEASGQAEARLPSSAQGGADRAMDQPGQHVLAHGHELQPATSDMASPLQPVPNVGVGDESDPLVHLKDRSNYAAFECAAMVHRSSRQSKGASSILVEKKDRYMLTPCSANPKFVDVELCDEIQIDTIVLANFEYFSSTFKHFRASCSVDYPGKPQNWHDLGTYRANNARGVQVFRPLRNPHFCRYLRLDFLSHYGSEYYCPVSLLRVYGFTQLDAYRESERKAKALEEALAAADLIDEQELLEVDFEDVPLAPPQPAPVTVEYHLSETGSSHAPADLSTTSETAQASPSAPLTEPAASTPTSLSSSATASATSLSVADDAQGSVRIHPTAETPSTTTSRAPTAETGNADAPASIDTTSAVSSRSSPSPTSSPSVKPNVEPTSSEMRPVSSSPVSEVPSSPTTATSSGNDSTAVASAAETTSTSVKTSMPLSPSATPSSIVRVVPTPETVVPVIVHQAPLPPPPPPPRPPVVQQPQPGESIYGTIMKRLTSLEHNQTISMHFIEAQSMMLKEAFGRVERRLHDIELSRGKQEQSVRQALLSLETQRVELERERLTLTTQVSLLSQEVRFGKRLTIAQLIGIFALIVFVGFTRTLPTSPFLHLAASAQAERGLRWRRDRSARGSSVDDSPSPTVATSPLPTAEAPRKGHRASPSTSLLRSGDGGIKRKLSLSKPTPRRHYAVASAYSSGGRNGLLRALDLSKSSSRPRTPPMRHSSAPPEEPPESHASALETREALRRRAGPSRSAGQTYRFPPDVSASSRLAQGSMAPASPGLTVPFPTPIPKSLTSPPSFPSPGEEADSEREVLLSVAEVASPALSTSTNGFGEDDAGYRTYSSGEETSPAHSRGPASLGSSPVAPRPPRHEMQIRPATSMGFLREHSRVDAILSSGQAPLVDRQSLAIGPLPHETTPEPPPERTIEPKPL